MRASYSDLEVVPSSGANAPEAVIISTEKEAFHGTIPKPPLPSHPPQHSRRIAPKRLWLIICGSLIVIAGAVGGAVGGTQANKHHGGGDAPVQDSQASGGTTGLATSTAVTSGPSSSPTSSPTKTRKARISTSTEIGPQMTLYRDCPSSNDTIYNALGSEQYQFRKVCGGSFPSDTRAGLELVNTGAGSLNDCIDLCVAYNVKNKTEIATGNSNLCNAVCWRHSLDDPDWPGQCFGYPSRNSSSGFRINREEVICDSGAWINS